MDTALVPVITIAPSECDHPTTQTIHRGVPVCLLPGEETSTDMNARLVLVSKRYFRQQQERYWEDGHSCLHINGLHPYFAEINCMISRWLS